MIALTKIDLVDSEIVDYQKQQLESVVAPGTQIFAISSSAHMFIKELLYDLS